MAPSVPPCVATKPVAVQTWVFNSQGWHRVAAGGTAPPAGAQVAYDARSGAVLAVQEVYYPCPAGAVPCEVPLSGKATLQPDQSFACTRTVCPITAPCYAPSVLIPPNAPDSVAGGFLCSGGSVSTWVWTHDRWSASPATLRPGTGQQIVGANLVASGAANAKLLVETFCADPAAKCLPPVTTQYGWDGSAWQVSRNGGGPFGPGDPTAIAAAGPTLVAIGTDGVWTSSHGGWSQTTAAAPAARAGAALAPGSNDSVILFGGFAAPAVGVATSSTDASRVGSDTWTFSATTGWHHTGGSPPPVSTPCASRKASPGCIEILPGAVSPRPTLVP